MKPSYSKFWAEYPDYIFYPDSAAVRKEIGGAVDRDWYENTCAIRLSRGLNYSGAPVPLNRAGMKIRIGADGKAYELAVRNMRGWLPLALGKPDVDLKKKAGDAFDKSTLSSMRGIIGFDISFGDATGHLDAWDGQTFSSEYKARDYWTMATRITLWRLF